MSDGGIYQDLYRVIDEKLAEVAAAAPAPLPWHDAWQGLGPRSTNEERLAVYRAVRDAGSLPEEAGFFLVAWAVDVVTDGRAGEGLREYEDRLEEVGRQFGVEEGTPANAEGVPAEYREAMDGLHDASDELYVRTLEEFGEAEIARLFQTDREEFRRRYEVGRQFFHGPGGEDDESDDDESDDEAWLEELYEAVAGCVEADSPMGPLGQRSWEEDGDWQVWIYPTPVELVGGRHDGEVVAPGITLDLEALREVFESVEAFSWNALALNWPEGPHVSIVGVFQGREVWLQVLAYAPEDEEPGLKYDDTRRRRE